MVAASQTHREIEFISPLGKDVLLVHNFSAIEELGRIYQFELTLRSTVENIDFESLLGQNVTVRLDTADKRYFNGYVTEFSQGENSEGFATYSATITPWLWFLTLTNDCRIFQEQKATDIIQSVFKDNGYTDFELRLSNPCREREYTVQYRESDFNFVSRLMEEEGIYYFFEHDEGSHKLVLCDSSAAHEPIKGESTIAYYPPDATTVRDEDIINYWKHTRRVLPGKIALNDYDFKKSRADIKTEHEDPKPHEKAKEEVYDYPGIYLQGDEGKHYARMRQEELHSAYVTKVGSGTAREFTAGGLYTMMKHPREDQNIEYLITRVVHEVDQDAFGSTQGGGSGFVYQNSFSVIESLTPFRTDSTTIPPKVEGPQNAKIVGPAGEEIYCDEYGRVKVQFPWDRYGKNNENSSCWIRVNQNWAGGSWGHMAIPRIDQEVIVEFYEGDPDRPIITGRVYNDANPVPYGLPAKKTQMTIKSKTHKGVGFNEMRFDDDNGKEEVFIHAQKDQNNVVLNNETTEVGVNRTEHVGNDETITIDNDRTETVHNNEKIRIDHNRTESVGDNEKISIGINRTEDVGKNEKIKIGKNRSVTIGKNKTETIGRNKAETIAIAKALSIGAAYQVSVGAMMNQTVGLSKSEQVGINKSEKIGSDKSQSIGKKYSLVAGDEISIVTGKSSIVMTSDGTITIKGVDINIIGDGEINVKAKNNIVMKGKNILEN